MPGRGVTVLFSEESYVAMEAEPMRLNPGENKVLLFQWRAEPLQRQAVFHEVYDQSAL